MNARERFLLLAVIVFSLAGLWQLNAAEEAVDAKAKPVSATEVLGGEERYLTHVSTDKPMYRPGEKVFIRGVMLHQATHKPLAQQSSASIEIIGPKGDVVATGNSLSEDGAIGFSWDVPQEQAGGEYTVKISHPWTGDAPAERKFDIRAYRAPRLKSQIKFLRDGYGAGDEVAATLEVNRAEGGAPTGAKVTIIARVDDAEAFRGETTVDDAGRALARFKLPAEIARGEGTLAMVIEDGGVVETASKTIPILLQTVDLTMYPEGGDLIAGVPNRVYFAALTPAKDPADLAGVVVDSKGKEVAKFKSAHEGRGKFSLTPTQGEKYTLKITEPSGIKTTYDLPQAKADGVAIVSAQDTFGEKIELSFASPKAQDVTITLSKREKELAKKEVKLVAGKPSTIELAAGEADGVLIATVRDATGKPLAERLVFRSPAKQVSVKITANEERYVPGGKAKLTITTTDVTGKPVSSVVGITVTDESVLEMIDKRDQTPRLPVMVFLENDVKELADAHVYLDSANEQAPEAVDLLLGTQGWRRFAFIDTTKFAADHGDAARRVLALRLQTIREQLKQLKEAEGRGRVFRFNAVPLEAAEAPLPQAAAIDEFAAADKSGAEPAAEEKPADAADDALNVDDPRGGLRGALEQSARKASEKQLRLLDARKDRDAQQNFVTIRVYAHAVRPDRQPGDRRDFAETLYWSAGVKTSDQGVAEVEFDLSDAVTSFAVSADAYTSDGAIGGGSQKIESVEPFYIEPKLPLEVTTGDYILVPVALANSTPTPLEGKFSATATGIDLAKIEGEAVSLPPNERVRKFLKIPVGKQIGPAEIVLTGEASGFADKVTRSFAVKPLGFPFERGQGGLLDAGKTTTYEVSIPDSIVAGSLKARAVVYPTPLASMTEALERLIQDPYGCFEQTSSTTYPLVMAQQYFTSHQGVDPMIIERASASLAKGYDRLIGFECKSGGFEWFGNDPGHDALSAYGILEFTDMAKVRHVDPAMLERTTKWLLAQRDGKGNFTRKTHTLHTWLPEPEVANTYNTWALLEAGVDADLTKEVKWIHDAAEKTENTYVMALAANVFSLAGDKEGEEHMLDKLAGKQNEDGSLKDATVSVVGSSGDALAIETTALAVMAWLKNPHYAEQVEKSIKYLAESCKGGRYGSTQSTVLALRAIVAYDQARAKPKADGALQLVVDGKKVGEPVKFNKETQGAIELPAFAELLAPGKHSVAIEMQDGSQMPYSIAVSYHAVTPDTSEKCKVNLNVKLVDAKVTEGELTEARVSVTNKSDETIPMPLAIVGIPGGMEVRHDQLKELVKAEKIAAYEVLGRDLVLYWRAMKGKETINLPISLTAAIPGKYTAPASRAYLYYTDEDKTWQPGLVAEIAPRK